MGKKTGPRGNFATSPVIDTVEFRWHGKQLSRKTGSTSSSRMSEDGGEVQPILFFLPDREKKNTH